MPTQTTTLIRAFLPTAYKRVNARQREVVKWINEIRRDSSSSPNVRASLDELETLKAYWRGWRDGLQLLDREDPLPDAAKEVYTTYRTERSLNEYHPHNIDLAWYLAGVHDAYNFENYKREDDPRWLTKVDTRYSERVFQIEPPQIQKFEHKPIFWEEDNGDGEPFFLT